MARLVSLTVYAKDSTAYPSASTQLIAADNIKFAENASAKVKSDFPSASAAINSVVQVNTMMNNQGEDHTLIVGETLGSLVTASA